MGIVVLLIVALISKGFAQPISFLLTSHSDGHFGMTYNFLIGLLLAQWTFTGYDASAHVSEETVDPRKSAPRGIFSAVACSAVFGLAMLLVVTLSIPNLWQVVEFGDNAFLEILKLRLGAALGTSLATVILSAMWLCGLATLTSASRMVYAFARDGGLPYSKKLAQVSNRFKTPAPAIWALTALAALLALSVRAESAVTSVAVIALYISYGLPIAARLYARWTGGHDERGPWDLGKFSNPVALVALLWIGFISVIFVIPPNEMAGKALAIFTGIVLLIWFFLARTRFPGPKYRPGGNAGRL
jgi:amino acid transporter